MELNINRFLGKVAKVGGGSLMVIIPHKNAEYEGLKEGDHIHVAIKKALTEETTEE